MNMVSHGTQIFIPRFFSGIGVRAHARAALNGVLAGGALAGGVALRLYSDPAGRRARSFGARGSLTYDPALGIRARHVAAHARPFAMQFSSRCVGRHSGAHQRARAGTASAASCRLRPTSARGDREPNPSRASVIRRAYELRETMRSRRRSYHRGRVVRWRARSGEGGFRSLEDGTEGAGEAGSTSSPFKASAR